MGDYTKQMQRTSVPRCSAQDPQTVPACLGSIALRETAARRVPLQRGGREFRGYESPQVVI